MQAPVPPLEKAWEFQADSSIREPGLTAAYNQIYFATKEGNIYALDATTGQAKWTFKMGKALELPLITAADGLIFAASKDKNLYAINAKTGKVQWQFQADGEIHSPAISTESIFFGCKDKKVYALNARSGQKLWETKVGHEKFTYPVIAYDKVLIGGDDDLFALDLNNGTTLWSVKNALWYRSLPVIANGFAFCCTKELPVIDLANGKEVEKMTFTSPIQKPHARELSHVDVVDGTLIATINLAWSGQTWYDVKSMDVLCAWDVATRKEKWQLDLKGAALRWWEIAAPYIYWADMRDNKLVVIDTSNTARWDTESLSKGDIGKPVIAYGMVFVSCGKAVQAFRGYVGSSLQSV